MEQHRKVKTIPAALNCFPSAPITEQKKRKAAGCAGVATEHDEQLTSQEAQTGCCARFIASRDGWEFVQASVDECVLIRSISTNDVRSCQDHELLLCL